MTRENTELLTSVNVCASCGWVYANGFRSLGFSTDREPPEFAQSDYGNSLVGHSEDACEWGCKWFHSNGRFGGQQRQLKNKGNN